MNTRFTNDSLNWRKLCRAAVLEQDANRLGQIVQRINSVLAIRQRMLRASEKTRQDDFSRGLSTLKRAA